MDDMKRLSIHLLYTIPMVILVLVASTSCRIKWGSAPEAEVAPENAATILRVRLVNRNDAGYKILEILKRDEKLFSRYSVGDIVRLDHAAYRGDHSRLPEEKIVMIGAKEVENDLFDERPYVELPIRNGQLPNMKGITVEEFRRLAAKPR
jgi:hypothetical protein